MHETEMGLSDHQAKSSLEKYGLNILPEKKSTSAFLIFVSQLKSPLVYVLVFAGLTTLLLGHYADSLIITIAIFINTFLGFFQEKRASNALGALKKLIRLKAIVIRNGVQTEIDTSFVVPGDICVLNSGDKVPADGTILTANRLFISEAILTGESIPVSKDKDSKAFMGTVITSGRGKLMVMATGSNTEVGKIAVDIQEPGEDTPIKRQLKTFANQLTILVIALTLFVFAVGLAYDKDPLEIFTTSVALAVSAIPEGLLIGLTVVLAISMQRILKRNGLVRNLVSAETLGGVTTICVDKTGTLTEGKMEVVEVFGANKEIAKQALLANDLDDPIVIALWEWASKAINWQDVGEENIDEFTSQNKRIDSIPFSAKERFFASLNEFDNKNNYIYVNGAPEYLLDWSSLSKKDKDGVLNYIQKFSKKGMRLIAMARKKVNVTKNKIVEKDVKSGLEWVGLIALSDPVRKGVKEALFKTQSAGVKIVVITGDYVQTATSVLQEVGLKVDDKSTVLGEELEKMTEFNIAKLILENKAPAFLFARTTPEQKLKIVEGLKQSGEVVAMTGDGVNDALALKRADIGIVVGGATEVAKESADLVLLDSSFATIVAAIEEGRGAFNNLRKIILYLMAGAFSEIAAVIGSLFVGIPLPIAAAQILWINLISDGFPHLALTVDPVDPKIMRHLPRSSKEQLVTGWMKNLIALVSIFSGVSAILVFYFFESYTGDLVLARSITFATLGVNSLLYVYSIRTLTKPFSSQNPFENKWLNLAVIGGLLLQILPFTSSFTRGLLGITHLEFGHWGIVFAVSISTFMLIEGFKKVLKIKMNNSF